LPKRRTAKQHEEEASVRPFWSGTITFGLVSIPVNLFPASHHTHRSLRMLSPEGVPLSRRYYSSKTGRELSDDEMVRGYEVSKDKFVLISDEELERVAPEKSRDIDLRRFVKKEEISPMYFENAYFLAPAGNSAKAYQLLAQTMERTGRAGIATFVMREREYLVAIVSENGILRAETLRFADELRSPSAVGLPRAKAAPKAAVRRFEKLIQTKSGKRLSREVMKDEYAERLQKLAQRKFARGKDVIESDIDGEKPETTVIDLMEVLKQSLKKKAA
jgi:DNA end-binding protein Ku